MGDTQKHTPGPWRALRSWEAWDGPYYEAEDAEENARMLAKPFTHISGPNGESVITAHDLFTFKTADAHLIAAAPDLLEALKALYEHEGEIETNGIGIDSDSEALELAKIQARAAIAKAEGRA